MAAAEPGELATPVGDPRASHRGELPTRTATAPGASSSSTTAFVENYLELKRELQADGHVFVTETDTEIIAHLIEEEIKSAAESGKTMLLEESVRRTVARLTGAFAISVISADAPDTIVDRAQWPACRHRQSARARRSSPPTFPASCTTPAMMYFLADGRRWPPSLRHGASNSPTSTVLRSERLRWRRILWDPIQAEKGGYKHFMLKEIFEQPRADARHHPGTCLPRIPAKCFWARCRLATEADFREATQIEHRRLRHQLALRARRQVHDRTPWARIPVEVDYASEYPLS